MGKKKEKISKSMPISKGIGHAESKKFGQRSETRPLGVRRRERETQLTGGGKKKPNYQKKKKGAINTRGMRKAVDNPYLGKMGHNGTKPCMQLKTHGKIGRIRGRFLGYF